MLKWASLAFSWLGFTASFKSLKALSTQGDFGGKWLDWAEQDVGWGRSARKDHQALLSGKYLNSNLTPKNILSYQSQLVQKGTLKQLSLEETMRLMSGAKSTKSEKNVSKPKTDVRCKTHQKWNFFSKPKTDCRCEKYHKKNEFFKNYDWWQM